MRWIEELQCLQVEMVSAIRFFKHEEELWRTKHELSDIQSKPGHASWAVRQSTMWCSMGAYSDFQKCLDVWYFLIFSKITYQLPKLERRCECMKNSI